MAKSGAKGRARAPAGTPAQTPDETPDEEGSAMLFKEYKDDDYVRLQRRDDTEKTLVYHGRLAPSEATADTVAGLFGGGFYRAQLFQRNEKGQYMIEGTRSFKVPGEYKPPRELPGIGPKPAPAAASNGRVEVGTLPQGGNAIETLNSALVASVIEMMKSFREKPQPVQSGPPIDWTTIIGGVLSLATVILKREPAERIDSLELLKQMKDLLPAANNNPATPVTNTIGDMIKGIRELMGLKDIVEGKETPPDPETAMWTLGGKALDAIMQHQGGNRQPTPTQTTPTTQLPPNMPRWKLLLLSQKKQLIQAASVGMDPATAAEVALSFLPVQANGVLTEFLLLPDHVAITMQTIPELAEFQHWTEQFYKELTIQFQGEDDATEGPGSPTGEEG